MNEKILYCTHAKGGAGSSLFATNFSYLLSKKLKDKKVLLLDANQMSDIAALFGVNQRKDIFNLEMFIEEALSHSDSENISLDEINAMFDKNVYRLNSLDILLSPQTYRNNATLVKTYLKIIPLANKIYDYIVIDTFGKNKALLKNISPFLNSLILTTNLDNLSIIKTGSLLEALKNTIPSEKILLLYNQADDFTDRELSSLFDATMLGTLPTEINGAWDNVLLGIPIVENNKLSYSKKMSSVVESALEKVLE